jgi:DNA-binding transcriptional LysR family regulator
MSTQTSVYPGSEPASPQVWRADSFYVMAEWLVRGLGWAWLPCGAVPDLSGADGRTGQRVDPPALVVELVWRRDEPSGRRRAGWPNVLPCTCRRSAKNR